ncbi:MAG: radical SAM protein [candidate division KSB1 bacterium]|nr:radical SAM protein [candidate division KSB1 bacterium]MDZ7336308.1 radical SAM protein [candidate division KSB1 bacterium]MDZ7357377.1 radical SAM protein [candidate division KSB1 bacterium]
MNEIWWGQVFRSASPPRIANFLKLLMGLGISSIMRKSRVWGIPAVLVVEPTALCNLRCPQCLVGLGRITRQRKVLDINLYKKVLDQIGDRLWYLLLYNQGEPFFHPQFLELIRLAKQRGIYVSTSTNGHFLSDEATLIELVQSGLDVIIVSVDGSDPASYSAYRQNGDFQRVIAGITQLIHVRTQLHRKAPKVLLQCLVTKHNEHQMPAMRRLAAKLKVDRLLFKTLQIEEHESAEQFLPEEPAFRRYQGQAGTNGAKKSLNGKCFRLWYSAVLLSDGRLVPCCFDKNAHHDYGQVRLDNEFESIWKSNASHQFRAAILQRQSSLDICENCTAHQKIYL